MRVTPEMPHTKQKSRRVFAIFQVAIYSFAVTACATHANLPVLDASKQQLGVARVYHLEIGDKLKINVFGEKDLSGTFKIDARGKIPFPLVGNIDARGRTTESFRRHLSKRLSNGYLRRPKLTVDIVNYRPIYVHGEVRSGGEHPFKVGLKLRDAIVIAGGYTYRAEESYVILMRTGQSGPVRIPLPTELTVLPGDNIRIPERFF